MKDPSGERTMRNSNRNVGGWFFSPHLSYTMSVGSNWKSRYPSCVESSPYVSV